MIAPLPDERSCAMRWTPSKPRRARSGVLAAPRPLARVDDLIIEELADELLIYDRANDVAHCLGATAARVWRACDGGTTVEGMSTALDLDAGTVARALDELGGLNLLEVDPTARATRRELTIRIAKAGAAVALVPPLVVSITAPASAQSASEIARCRAIVLVPGGNCGNKCHQNCCCCCEPSQQLKFCTPVGATQACSDQFCREISEVATANCSGGGRGGDCPDGTPC
jgi:hypothetical protein